MNGHTYKGREHWTRLWQFYQPNVRSGYWTPFDLGGVVSNDLAVVWCERQTQSEWICVSAWKIDPGMGVIGVQF